MKINVKNCNCNDIIYIMFSSVLSVIVACTTLKISPGR